MMVKVRDCGWVLKRLGGGRPLRVGEVLVLGGCLWGSWVGLSWSVQRGLLAPFLVGGEGVRFFGGEGFIVCGGGMVVRDRLVLEEGVVVGEGVVGVEGFDGDVVRRASLEGMRRGYAAATARFAEDVVELEGLLISEGLAEGSSVAERKLAFAVVKDWKDRTMGKAVQAVEVSSGGGGSVVQRLAERGALEGVFVPPSARGGVEGVLGSGGDSGDGVVGGGVVL